MTQFLIYNRSINFLTIPGNPKEQTEDLRAAGVQGFVHIFSDAIETLTYWLDKLAIGSMQ